MLVHTLPPKPFYQEKGNQRRPKSGKLKPKRASQAILKVTPSKHLRPITAGGSKPRESKRPTTAAPPIPVSPR